MPAIKSDAAGWFRDNVIILKIPTVKYKTILGKFKNDSLVG
jgi:hypothetical protein